MKKLLTDLQNSLMNMSKTKIAWGITGAGDKIRSIKKEMEKIRSEKQIDIHIFVSKAGKQVLEMYQIMEELQDSFERFSIEKNSNTPFLAGRLQTGAYDALILAPTTSNTVAKISRSIGDTLLTNSALMALKAFTPVHILPTDLEAGTTKTELPNGDILKVRVREEDAENVEKLRNMDGVYIVESPEKLESHVNDILEKD